MEGHAVISHDVLASYAADAAREVEGVHELVDGPRRHQGVRVAEEDGALASRCTSRSTWGARAPEVGDAVQRRVADYLVRTAELPSVAVDVVVAGVAARRRLDAGRRLGPHPRHDPLRRPPCAATASGGSRAATAPPRRSAGSSAPRRTGASGGRSTSTSAGRLLGSLQYGPSHLFPRAADLPAGPRRTTPCS